MSTLSERWFTTQTSVLERAAAATGSSPTGTECSWRSLPPATANTSSRLAGVLVAKRRLPSGERASGRTGPDSKATNDCAEATGASPRPNASTHPTSCLT
jgi:hypothetical protein